MKLTPIQRYSVYLIMYAENLPTHKGFCDHLHKLFSIYNKDIISYRGLYPEAWSYILKLLPELDSRKPKNENWLYNDGHYHDSTAFWFDLNSKGNAKRKEILKECIIEMEQKLF